MEAFENYFKRADANQDGKISGAEAVAFFQGSGLPQQVLAQIWMYADQNKTGFLGRPEFFNALRLVTVAQGGHALKPDIVKSALYGPASSKIPPPKINSVPQASPSPSPSPQPAPSPQSGMGGLNPAQYTAPRAPQATPPNMGMMRPPQTGVNQGFTQPPLQTPGVNMGLVGGNTGLGPRGPVTTSSTMGLSSDWLSKPTGTQPRPPITNNTDAFGLSSLTSSMGMTPTQRPQVQQQPNQSSSILSSLTQPVQTPVDSRSLILSQSGISPDMFSTKPSTSIVPATNPSPQMGFAQLDPLRSSQTQPVQAGPTPPTPNTTQPNWPKMSKADVTKYTKVFGEVDKDRDGRITGLEARNLFLSWKLPREVLKQVWDLSDQDNDGMLTLREFCIALYLMERHRQGATLPKELPNSLRFDEALLQATGLPAQAYSAAPTWQQNQGMGNRPPVPVAGMVPGMRPPLPGHMNPRGQVRPGQPGMDNNGHNTNHGVNQGNRDVPAAVPPQAQEMGGSDKPIQIEKQILDSREKIEFFRTKMQDLVLYKSRCDNRLNEITERALSDKREVESLAKKYEEKYKQVGDIASKLQLEEASIRDITERKTELQNAISKMEQGGSADGLLQVRADRIQYQLEELEKAMSERCKHFGLNVKPSASIELPFGWEHGAPEGAMDWDEDWDKFEDEGFMVVKANTTEVEHVAPEKDKTASLWNDDSSMDGFSPVASSSNGHAKHESEDTESISTPGRRSTFDSPFVSSPRIKDDFNDNDGAESIFGDKYANEASWNFDDTDTESVWGANAMGGDDQRNSFFGSGGEDYGLDPVRVNSPSGSSVYGKKKSTFFDDSVPSSPAFSASGFSPKFNDSSSFNYGRFDSFKTEDSSVLFGENNNNNNSNNHFGRFDSISSSKGETLSRFDSMRSSANMGHNRRFDSFDDNDPFGSSGPFKASGSRSPPRF